MDEDQQLVQNYSDGNEEAFEELVKKYQRQIYSYAYRMTNDAEDAKDLTQKVFMNAAKGIKYFRNESSFKTWLFKIATNAAINQSRIRKYPEVELDETMASIHDSGLSSVIDKEMQEHIKQGIAALPERQRLAIVLRVYEGLSCAETARVLGCSEGAIKANYHLAVKKLREFLKEHGYESGS